ncbi:MAG: NAD(P)H-binding protein, partial [Gemmatimonadetes bacterium]|nr:NAD(P)H-binding protein [Gemmatimonadota bacterium]
AELAAIGSAVVTGGRRAPPAPLAGPAPDFHEVDFEAWAADPTRGVPLFRGADAVFVALGTTLRAAGSRDAFRRVDLDYVVSVARAARAAEATQLLPVSSVGASTRAGSFYLQVKGEAEEALRGLGFPSLTIARPSLLLGDRDESRPLEAVSTVALRLARPILRGPFARYRPIEARTVARALVRAAADPATGTAILESHHLAKLGA